MQEALTYKGYRADELLGGGKGDPHASYCRRTDDARLAWAQGADRTWVAYLKRQQIDTNTRHETRLVYLKEREEKPLAADIG